MDVHDLINELSSMTQQNRAKVQEFKNLPMEYLERKPMANSWNVLECIAHLNRYGDFYIPEIQKQLEKKQHQKSAVFKSGLLGNYFANSMRPKENLNRMKTFKSMDPEGSMLDQGVLDLFLAHQEQLLNLLEQCKYTDLTRTKTVISIMKGVRLRLGDTLRVVIFHNARHVVQAEKAVKMAMSRAQ